MPALGYFRSTFCGSLPSKYFTAFLIGGHALTCRCIFDYGLESDSAITLSSFSYCNKVRIMKRCRKFHVKLLVVNLQMTEVFFTPWSQFCTWIIRRRRNCKDQRRVTNLVTVSPEVYVLATWLVYNATVELFFAEGICTHHVQDEINTFSNLDSDLSCLYLLSPYTIFFFWSAARGPTHTPTLTHPHPHTHPSFLDF